MIDKEFFGLVETEVLLNVVREKGVACTLIGAGGGRGEIEGCQGDLLVLNDEEGEGGDLGDGHGLDVGRRAQDAADLAPKHLDTLCVLDLIHDDHRPAVGGEAAGVLVQRIVGKAAEEADGAVRGRILFRCQLDSEKIRDLAHIEFRFARCRVLKIIEFIECTDHEKYGSLTTIFLHIFFVEFSILVVHGALSFYCVSTLGGDYVCRLFLRMEIVILDVSVLHSVPVLLMPLHCLPFHRVLNLKMD